MPAISERFLGLLRRTPSSQPAILSADLPAPTEEEIKSWRSAQFTDDDDEFLCRITSPRVALVGILSAENRFRLYLPYERYGEGDNALLIDRIIGKNNLGINDHNFREKQPEILAGLGVRPNQSIAALWGAGGNYVIHFLVLEETTPRPRDKSQGEMAAEFARIIESNIPGTTVTPVDPKTFQQS